MKSTDDTQTLKEALVAAAYGPFFPDWEFPTLFSLGRAEVEHIAKTFSSTTPITGNVLLAVNNALTNLLGYPHGQETSWAQWLSVTPDQLEVVFQRWQAAHHET